MTIGIRGEKYTPHPLFNERFHQIVTSRIFLSKDPTTNSILCEKIKGPLCKLYDHRNLLKITTLGFELIS